MLSLRGNYDQGNLFVRRKMVLIFVTRYSLFINSFAVLRLTFKEHVKV